MNPLDGRIQVSDAPGPLPRKIGKKRMMTLRNIRKSRRTAARTSAILTAFIVGALTLLLCSCRTGPTGPDGSDDSGFLTELDSPGEPAMTDTDGKDTEKYGGTDTDTDTDSDTQADLPGTDLSVTETSGPETEVPDVPLGEYTDATHVFGFTSEKSDRFFKVAGAKAVYNEDGSLTLVGNWKKGDTVAPAVTLRYAAMMKSCLNGYRNDGDIANGGTVKYPYLVLTVSTACPNAGDSCLEFEIGKRQSVSGGACAVYEPRITEDGRGKDYVVFDLSATRFTEEAAQKITLTWACGKAVGNGGELTVYGFDFLETPEQVYALTGYRKQERNEDAMMKLDGKKLSREMADIFGGDTVYDETVMFLREGQEKALLFPIDRILSVTSYDGSVTYREGIDYALTDGKITALTGSGMPIITEKVYYGADSSSILTEKYGNRDVYVHWGEGRVMTDWQVCVTYTHTAEWDGFRQACHADVYGRLFGKLERGEDVTVMFYGDSCTYGAASSYAYGYPPYQYSYAMLVTNALAELFDYTVHYVSLGKGDTCYVPQKDYVCGTRGTVTFINPSVGGWTSADGVASFDEYAKPYILKYGVDLFVSDIGGNDGSGPAAITRQNVDTIISRVLELAPDASITVMSTMVANPDSTNGWSGTEYLQEPMLEKACEKWSERGVPCALCKMTSMCLSVLDHVEFKDVSGNNVNHPNDFLARIYARTLFQTIVGYQNLG